MGGTFLLSPDIKGSEKQGCLVMDIRATLQQLSQNPLDLLLGAQMSLIPQITRETRNVKHLWGCLFIEKMCNLFSPRKLEMGDN